MSIEKRVAALISDLKNNKIFRKRWYKMLTGLAVVVVFCTTYALILPAVTLTGDPTCGEEEHTHTDACIGEVLICGYGETGGKADSAFAKQMSAVSSVTPVDPFEPICGLEEHIHTDECYEWQQVKLCLNEDPTHVHDDACFVEELVLTCGEKEHTHTQKCYPEPEEFPEFEELEPPTQHVHTDACYAEEYICGLKEHTHTDACYADSDEIDNTSVLDNKTEDDDNSDAKEKDANAAIAKPWEIALSLTGNTKTDIVKVAESQLGYKESTDDYIEDTLSGSAQGYTIYGDWYGEPYSEWSAIFVAYCLNQAGVDEFDFPYESDPLFWMEDLRSAGLLKNIKYKPEAGDLVFLDTDIDGLADKVGIINEIDNWSELFTCVVGDSNDRVQELEYLTMDFEVLAFAAVREDEFAMPDIDDDFDSDFTPGGFDDFDDADVEFELDSIFDNIPELPEDVSASEMLDDPFGEDIANSELTEDGELPADSKHTDEVPSMPARPLSTEVFTYKDEDVRIAVTLPAGAAVPPDATLEVTLVDSFDPDYGMILSMAQEALDDNLAQEYLAELEAWGLLNDSIDRNAGKAIIGDLTYYNISFTTSDGETLPLEEGAQVTVRYADGVLPVAVDTADYSVLVYPENGTVPSEPATLTTEWTSNAIRFTADSDISGFAVVSSEEYNTASIRGVTADDGSARVVVELPDGSGVPQAASLNVVRVLPGEPAYDYYRMTDQADEKIAGIDDLVLYDIYFTLDDMTYDVPDTAQVTIRLLDNTLLIDDEEEVVVLRYGHSSELPGIVSARAYLDSGNPVIAFETEGFAVFGIAKVSESDISGTYAIIAQTEADFDELDNIDAEPYKYYALTANEQTVGIVTGLQGAEVTMNDSDEPVAAQDAGVAFWKLEKISGTTYTVQEAESGDYLNVDAAGALTLSVDPQEFTLSQSGDGTVALTVEDATVALLETEDEDENLFAADSTDSAPVTGFYLYNKILISGEDVLQETRQTILTYEDDDTDYIVTVTYGEDADLPEDTELVVIEYEQDSDNYIARYAETAEIYGWDAEEETETEENESYGTKDALAEIAEESVEDETTNSVTTGETADEDAIYISSFRLFDISLVADDTEVEPAAAVSVSITYKDVFEELEDVTVIHFAENTALIPVTVSSNNVIKSQNAFGDAPERILPESLYDTEQFRQTFSFEVESFSEFALLTNSEATLTAEEDETLEGTAIASANDFAAITSGSYYLSADITVSTGITISDNVTVDLNGHTITYTGNDRLFSVNNGGSLTIKDSADSITDEKDVGASGNLYGNTATVTTDSDGSATLEYYVTESTSSNDGTTTETLYKHTVTVSASSGKIICENAIDGPIYAASGGTVNIEGGYFYNTGAHIVVSEWNGSGSAINITGGYFTGATTNAVYVGNGTFNMSDGYIAGNSGNGVYINSGTGTISGGVIAGNTAGNGGGVYVYSGSLEISGGVISGNTATSGYGGGGVYVASGSMTISGGYITNNTATAFSNEGGGSFGGGGVYFASSGTISMSGGYITGNYAKDAGGGLYVAYGSFSLSGGTIASNVAQDGEGGGMRIGIWTAGVIAVIQAESSVYITNNSTYTDYSWGGGGIFVTDGNTLTIVNSVVTENSAGGFGGGVAGCSTGRVYVLDTGSAVYGNTAAGTNLTQSSEKTEDHDAAANTIFMNSGYEDFFCAMNSIVYDQMLGGGSANWTGSCDYSYIEIATGGSATASTMMGLTANPNGSATSGAMSAASVYITGNYSYTHGGGIMSNGILLMGETDELEVSPGLTIHGTKSYLIQDEEAAMTAGQFTFLLLSESPTETIDDDGNVTGLSYDIDSIVGTATNTADGDFLFSLQYTEGGTYTYYLVEKAENNSITYDMTYYTIVVTVTKSSTAWAVGSTKSMNVTYYLVTNVVVTSSDSTKNITVTPSNLNSENHTASVTIGNDNTATFTNTGETGKVTVTIKKVWHDGNNTSDRQEITVALYKNDEKTNQTVTLNNDNGWTATFSDLEKYKTDSDGNSTGEENVYAVSETDVPGGYTCVVSADANEGENFEYTITNIHDIAVLKVDSKTNADGTYNKLSGAVFTLQNGENKYYSYTGDDVAWVESVSNAAELTSGNDGTITLHTLTDGEYTLTEITAPAGYNKLVNPISFTITNGKVSLSGNAENVSVDDGGLIITVKNDAGYSLPSTGGIGTTLLYFIGGMLVLSAIAILAVQRRRHSN